jgi:hypothetical protein
MSSRFDEDKLWWMQPGTGIGDAAKRKIMAGVGDHEWHPRESLVEATPVTVMNSGIPEPMYVVTTLAPSAAAGAVPSGRVLLAFDPEARMSVGGLYWIEEGGRKKLQSAYLDADFRGGRVMPLLVDKAKALGVKVAVGPMSTEGKKFAKRYNLRMVR